MCETSASSTFKNHRLFPYWLKQEQRLKSSSKPSKIRRVSPVSFSGLLCGFFYFYFYLTPDILKKVKKKQVYLSFFLFFPSFLG